MPLHLLSLLERADRSNVLFETGYPRLRNNPLVQKCRFWLFSGVEQTSTLTLYYHVTHGTTKPAYWISVMFTHPRATLIACLLTSDPVLKSIENHNKLHFPGIHENRSNLQCQVKGQFILLLVMWAYKCKTATTWHNCTLQWHCMFSTLRGLFLSGRYLVNWSLTNINKMCFKITAPHWCLTD